MCGIIGIVGNKPVAPLLLDGLKRLEYRGYDSAGIATLVNGAIDRRRAEGRLANLATLLDKKPIDGTIGIGHTRWATHGVPSEVNAHPHATKRVAVVHNGIIENFQELREELSAHGNQFETAAMFVPILCLMLMGVVYTTIALRFEHWVAPWRFTDDE